MLKADALSWRPDHQIGVENDNEGVVLLIPERIAELHINSIVVAETEANSLVDLIRTREPAPINAMDKSVKWEQVDGLTLRDSLIVVRDEDIRRRILEMNHDLCIAGHPGRSKTRELIGRNYWWPKLTEYVNRYVDGCHKCQTTKVFPRKPQGLLSPNAIPS